MSVEDIVVGEIEEAEVPERLKIAVKRRQMIHDALFNSLDPKLKNVGDAVSFSIKEGVNSREVRGPAIRYKLREKGRDGEWNTYWDEEEKKIYVEKVK
ncbi:hypothetical protein KAS14_06330 [Candidatus Bathyarchaeota archaeon]|nr:hypothetical protein [Candidatus Bathyarchaeota archaeon]